MGDSHTIEAAMRREELTEEESYFILRFAGRMGYDKAIKRLSNPFQVLRQWFVWFGGWESPALSQWDRHIPAWSFVGHIGKKKYLKSPWPVSLFGHRITLHGKWGQMKCFGGYLVASNSVNTWANKLFWSPNGTPTHPRARLIFSSKKGRDYFREENERPGLNNPQK